MNNGYAAIEGDRFEFELEDEFEAAPRSPTTIEYDGVFEGGGAKGGAFVGALAFMEKHGRWFKRVAGTSAGAITAALVASGYRARREPSNVYQKPQESLEDVVFNTDFTKFLDSPNPATFSDKEIERSLLFKLMNEALPAMLTTASPLMAPGSQAWKLLPTSLKVRALRELLTRSPEVAISGFKLSLPVLFSLLERGGAYAGQAFYQIMNGKIRQGLLQRAPGAPVSAEPTFSEVFKRTGISLNLVASDIGKGRMLVMNEVLNPQMPVAKAVRMSMSIPFIFTPVINDSGCAVVDGGMLSNYPMFLFRKNNLFVRNSPEDLKRKNIGFLLDEQGAAPSGPTSQRCPATEFSPVDFMGKLINTMMEAFDRRVTGDFTVDTVRINAVGFSTTQFQMTASQKRELANRGWEAAGRFFKKRGEIAAPAASPYGGGTQQEISGEAEFGESESEDGEFPAESFEADERFEFEFEAPATTGTPGLAVINWGGRSFQVARSIAPRIERLLHAAKADGINLTVNSAYRDPAQQVAMRRKHCGPTRFDIYQKPASQCTPPTARPGTSNHEKGLAIDFGHNGGRLDPNGAAFAWLSRNAGTYGLINYKKEPWHWSVDGN